MASSKAPSVGQGEDSASENSDKPPIEKSPPVETLPQIKVGPPVAGRTDGTGRFVSSLDDFLLVEEATAYEYGLDCDQYRWRWWSEDQASSEVVYANEAALNSLSAANADPDAVLPVSCSPSDVEMADNGETVKFALSTSPDARNKLGEMLDGTIDEQAIAANLNCQTLDADGGAYRISMDYCGTSRAEGVIVMAYHTPAGADLGWLAAMVNAYADNDSQVQYFIDEKMTVTEAE